jgi:O-antigen/teichoic acid export membrane protein
MPDSLPVPPSGSGALSFVGHVNLVFFSQVANALLALGVQVLLARSLGPEGRGVYGIFMLSASIAQALLSLGINVAAVYYLGKGAVSIERVLANTLQVMIIATVATGLTIAIIAPYAGDWFGGHEVPYWALVFVIPLFISYNVSAAVFQGTSRFLSMNAVFLTLPLVQVIFFSAGAALLDVEATEAVLFWTAGASAAALVTIALLRPQLRDVSALLRFDWRSLREQVVFGMQGQIGNLAQLLNYRFDQYMVLALRDASSVGIYAVSVSISQSIWFLSDAVAKVLLPRLTAAEEGEAARSTALICRNTLLVSALGAAAVALFSPLLLEPVFGDRFSPSLRPLLWLLPGTVLLAGSKIVTSYVFSQGRPLINSGITIGSLVVTLVADLALIPPFGVSGAAVASSIAYASHLAMALLAYRMLSQRPISEALFIQREDLARYVSLARQARSAV